MKSGEVLHTLQAWKNERFEILALWVSGTSRRSPGYTTLSFKASVSDVNESELHLEGSGELAGFFNLEDASWTGTDSGSVRIGFESGASLTLSIP
jgi:hypothetical protein